MFNTIKKKYENKMWLFSGIKLLPYVQFQGESQLTSDKQNN